MESNVNAVIVTVVIAGVIVAVAPVLLPVP
jgi:hypothetical protein